MNEAVGKHDLAPDVRTADENQRSFTAADNFTVNNMRDMSVTPVVHILVCGAGDRDSS